MSTAAEGEQGQMVREQGQMMREQGQMMREQGPQGPQGQMMREEGQMVEEQGQMVRPAMRKPVFVKVDQLKPGTNGHTLSVKVLESKTVLQKSRAASTQPRQSKISECIVGDETGTIIFTARNDQVDMMKVGATVTLRNAKIDMFKGSMRLAVDKWGRVEVTEPGSFSVKDGNNLSLVEYELVNVAEE